MERGKRPPPAEKKKEGTRKVLWRDSTQTLKATVLGSALQFISFTSVQALQPDYRRQVLLFLTVTFFPSTGALVAQMNNNYYISVHSKVPSNFK